MTIFSIKEKVKVTTLVNEELREEVMKVFPSLDFYKAGFLIEMFGEENTEQIVHDAQARIDEIKNVLDKLFEDS